MSGPETSAYTTQAIASYNASPPADDGSQVASNQGNWSFVKTKIGDPIKTLAEAINTQLVTAFGKVPNTDADVNNAFAGSISFESSALTIASGSVTPTRGFHVLTGEGSVSDTLTDMAVTNAVAGMIVILTTTADAQDITVAHDSGTVGTEFFLTGGAACILGTTKDRLAVQYVSSIGWVELFRSVAGSTTYPTVSLYNSAGTATFTPNTATIWYEAFLRGGGGGGGGAGAGGSGGGGGEGESAYKLVTGTAVLSAINLTVGTAGLGGAATPAAGASGGTTSLGTLATAAAGAGGAIPATGGGGAGGTGGTGATQALKGAPGGTGSGADLGAGAGGGAGGGAAARAAAVGGTGVNGGGGGGGTDNNAGGPGGAGYILIKEYYQ